jgi:hypothetical protein
MTEGLQQAERAADRVRGEFLRTIDELDRRRHQATDLKRQLRGNWKLLAALGGVLGAMIAGKALLSRRAREHQVKALQRERGRSLLRAWQHPDRIAPARHSPAVELGSQAISILGTAIATQLARRLAQRVVG